MEGNKQEKEKVRIEKAHEAGKIPGRKMLLVKGKILCAMSSLLSMVFGCQRYRRERNLINCFERMIWSAKAHTNLKLTGYRLTSNVETPCALFVRCVSNRFKRVRI